MSIIEEIAAPNGHTHYRVRSDLDLGAAVECSTPTIARRAVEKAWADLALDTYRKACGLRVLLSHLDVADGSLIDEADLRALIAAHTEELTSAIWRLGTEGAAATRGTVNEGLVDLAEEADRAYRAAEDAPENTNAAPVGMAVSK